MLYTSLTGNDRAAQPLHSHVSLIPPLLSPDQTKPLQIAVYCRVSTDFHEQKYSYQLQMSYYTSYVQKQKNWNLYKIFADEGISGTSRKKRSAFNQMMADATEGKINYIITKSISRFARNTVDALHCIRTLRSLTPPVGVYFEKEKIDTLDSCGELIVTILSALAQDESRSISDNVKWTIQKKFQNGIDVTNLSCMIGYELGKNGEWLIQEEQACVVRYIYQRYLDGLSHAAIARELMEHGWVTGKGNPVWRGGGVYRILTNEKYVGDSLLQKTITKDLFTHQSIRNNGTLPSYYIRNHHPAIIDRSTWDAVQAERRRRSQKKAKKDTSPQRYSGKWEFSSKLFCGDCSEPLIRRTFRLGTKPLRPSEHGFSYLRYPVWRCRAADQKKAGCVCHAESYLELSLKQSFMEYLYHLRHELMLCMPSAPDTPNTPTAPSLTSLFSCRIVQEFTALLQRSSQSPIPESPFPTGSPEVLLKQFHWFLTEVLSLPECAADGSPLRFSESSVVSHGFPDLLPFAGHIFQKIVLRGNVFGDEIVYETRFGVPLMVKGNHRRFRDFYGFREVAENGQEQILSGTAEIAEYLIRHSDSAAP